MIDWQDTSTWRVLVVDDEPDNLEVVAETLEYMGAHVKTAQNGKDGIEALVSFDATLILTDLSMPIMDGWQMRVQVKNNPKTASIPVLALSAHAILGDKERALDAGFDGYLTKPINISTLLDDIRSAVVKLDQPVSSVAQLKPVVPAVSEMQSASQPQQPELGTVQLVVAKLDQPVSSVVQSAPVVPAVSETQSASQPQQPKLDAVQSAVVKPDQPINSGAQPTPVVPAASETQAPSQPQQSKDETR